MKRLIALLLGIVLLLTAVPALADEETDDLNEIARKVEEEYLLPLSEGEGAKTEVLEVCLEMLKDAKGGPKKKPLELYCQVLLAIEKGDFDDANYTMFVLSQGSMKKTFNQEFIEKSGGESITSLLTIEELALYLQGREAEQNNERDAALAAYDQCNNRADAYYRIKKIEDEQYDDAIEMKRQGKYDSAKEILKKLAERQYPWAIEDLKDWATPTPKPTAKSNASANATPKPTATPKPPQKGTAKPTTASKASVSISLQLNHAGINSVDLSWTCGTSGVTYEVQRKDGSSSSWTTLATISSKSYTDNSAQAGTKYTYRIVAKSAIGTSNEVSVTTLQNSTPTPKPKTWGSWSSWSTSPVSASSTRQVETKVETQYNSVPVYNYSRWYYYNTSWGQWTHSYTQYTGSNYKSGSGEWQYKTTSQPLAKVNKIDGRQQYNGGWWNESISYKQESYQVTYYRYRDLK